MSAAKQAMARDRVIALLVAGKNGGTRWVPIYLGHRPSGEGSRKLVSSGGESKQTSETPGRQRMGRSLAASRDLPRSPSSARSPPGRAITGGKKPPRRAAKFREETSKKSSASLPRDG
jgi:hypothetical protein